MNIWKGDLYMISLLNGEICNISDNSVCMVLSSGIGFEVFCNRKTLSRLEIQKRHCLFIHTQLSQEDIQLYGFIEERELNFFKMLIKVNGVGCKMAQSILDLDVATLSESIINNDVKSLTKIKGVGAKTAQRIILELKNVVETKYKGLSQQLNENVSDAKYALIALGYNPNDIDEVLINIDDSLNSSDIIKMFLKKTNI